MPSGFLYRSRFAVGNWFIAISLAFCLIFTSQAAVGSAFDPLPIDVSQAVADEIDERGKARIIVGLDLPHKAEGKLNRPEILLQRANIRAQQNALMKELGGQNAEINAQFTTIPYLALTVDERTYEALKRSPRVRVIELDEPAEATLSTSNPVIGSPAAWAAGHDGTGFAVAVLDTGVDNSHPWFTTGGSKVVSEACYSSVQVGFLEPLCPGGLTESTSSGSGVNCNGMNGCDHGTHVAGIVAGNDGTGPDYGVARGSDIIAIQVFTKVLDDGACGAQPAPCILSYSSDQIKGMERVLELTSTHNIASVNMSIGGGGYTSQATCDSNNSATKTAIDNLRSVGIATVISSGNNSYINALSRPACISSAISVGATSDSDQVSYFSNIASFLDLLAPGQAINSSVPGGGTAFKQGTSMAAPHVAGAWAVLKQVWPEATVDDLEGVLKSEGTLVDDTRGGGIETDMPRINLDLSINAAIDLSQGTLAGTVVDAADGVTPVHPVAVDLADPATGEWLAIGVTNEVDGTWEISGLAPGFYKVFFNAFGTANGYEDELHDGIPCDNGACDVASLGTATEITVGPNSLDVDLDRIFLLSGTVTDAESNPIEDALVQVTDALGGPPFGGITSTDENGFWSQPVADPGNYFTRVIESGRIEYIHEVWNNKPCDGCDPAVTGDAIVVSDSDVPNIDFQLDYGGGTLSGTVVDADDGVTPVHPVRIDLVNADTGFWEGFATENAADGSYSLQGIPPGDYKVFFNAFDGAESYVDELHDNVACSNGMCDRATLGATLMISTGDNTLDIDLSRLSVSGTLVDESGQPMPNVAIDVLDETGALLPPGAVWTDESGNWLKYLPGPGTYYAKTIGEWTPNHQPEIWNDVPCDLCEAVTWGDPIEVSTEDITGIDFQLFPRPQVVFSGTVVSAHDGFTPVHPVAVDLLDPVSGATLGFVAETDEAGRFTFTDVPVGPYKMIFNAFGAADSFEDELYNNITCIDFSCDASNQGEIVQILPGYSEVHVDMYAPTTLSGIVVDARDGVTPVHPVFVELFDVANDLALFAQVQNLEDGTYEFSDIPPGDYQLFFNGLDQASHYLGQFSDGTVCPNPYCWPERSEVTPITIAPGVNTFDLQMRDFVVMSGVVRGDSGQPLADVPVEIFDASGTKQDEGLTDEKGAWSARALPRQSNYARIANVDLNGHIPQVWNDHRCYDCDPPTTGDPIVIEDKDVEGIDFNLRKPKEVLKACSSNSDINIIHGSGFEPLPERKIVFTSGNSGLLTGIADQADFEVELHDESDTPIDDSQLVWCLSDDSLLQLDAAGGSASVTATGFEPGSADLVVRDPDSLAEARIPLIFAELQDNAFEVEAALFIEGETPPIGETRILRLERTAFSESLQVGDVIATDGTNTVFGRIVSLTLFPDYIEFIIESAGVPDFFANIDLETESAPIAFEVTPPAEEGQPAQMTVYNPDGTQYTVDAPASTPCTGSLGSFKIESLPLKFNGEFRLKHRLRHNELDESLNQIDIWAEGKVGVESTPIQLTIEVAPKAKCELDLPKIPTPAQIGIFKILNLGLEIAPKIGIEAAATSPSMPSFNPKTPSFEASLEFDAGFGWSHNDGFYPIGKIGTDYKTEPGGLPAETPDAYEFTLKPYAAADLELGANVLLFGYGIPMLRFEAGAPANIKLERPIFPAQLGYKGPMWSVRESYEFKYDPRVADFISETLSHYLGLPKEIIGWDISVPLFQFDNVLLENPSPELGVKCSTGGLCFFDPDLGGTADFKMELGAVTGKPGIFLRDGEARLVGWLDENDISDPLVSGLPFGPITGAEGSWAPNASDEGRWTLAGRIHDIDGISDFLPYVTNKVEFIEVGDAFALTTLVEGMGTITSSPSGVNCRDNCQTPARESKSITLTAGADPGWWFQEWRSDGECGGSTAKSCLITMDADKTAIAVFSPNPTLSVEVHDQSGPNSTVGSVNSTPGGINCGPICSSPMAKDEPATLKAVPSEGWLFDRWEACPAAVEDQCTLTMTTDAAVTAVFREKPKVVIVDKVDLNGAQTLKGWITSSPADIDCGPDCEGEFINFATIQLTATSYGDWDFRRWAADSEACAGSENPFCVVPLDKDVNRVKAVFSPGERTLTVQKVDSVGNPINQGLVTSNPAGINCGNTCQNDFQLGSNVFLTAADQGIWVFKKWADDSGACAGSANTECIVNIDNAKTVKAEFERLKYELALMGRDINYQAGTSGFYEHAVLQDGQDLTLLPGGLYRFRLKLDGVEIPVTCFNSVSFEDEGSCHDLGGPEPCLETPSTTGFTVRFTRNQNGSYLVYGGSNYTAPGVQITIHDSNNNRDVTFTFNVTVVTAIYQAVNGQTFYHYDSEGNYTGESVTLHEAVRTPILAGYKGEWTSTVPWGRYESTTGIWAPWFKDGLHTYTRYTCSNGSVDQVTNYGAAQLYETVYCGGGYPDWMICNSNGCNTNYSNLICSN